MIEYQAQLNLGNEALGSEKTITANEAVRTCDTKALAREISHQNKLIPEDVAEAVLAYFCKAAVEKMTEGFAVQLMNGNDVALRIFPDIHVKGGNINLARAKQLDPEVTDLTLENAGDLIDKAGGVTVRVRATVQPKFTELLEAEGYQLKRVGVVQKDYVEKKDGDDDEPEQPGTGGGNNGENTGGNTGGNTGDGDSRPDED